MSTLGCEGELLRRLASMPFLDRLDMAAVSGWSRGAVYAAVEGLEARGLALSVPHTTQLIPPTRRYHLSYTGLNLLAGEEGMTVDELLALYPVSAQWQRILMERLDALAVIYRLASAISNLAHPFRFRWYRASPMDAAIALPDGRTLAIVRQGLTADRTAFSKRLWRLRDGPPPSALLMLMPDEVRLRHARRLLSAAAPAITFLALEEDAASAGANSPIWRIPSGSAALDLRSVLYHTRLTGAFPTEEDTERASLPEDLTIGGPENAAPDRLLPTLLKATEKRALDLLSDWPWVTPSHLGAVLGVKRSRLSQILVRLEGLGLVVSAASEGRRLALTDRGLGLLARRDRTSVGATKRRWTVTPFHQEAPLGWRNVSGARSRQLLRNIQHTDSVHWFAAVLSRQARSRSREVVQLDPPWRASRYFRHGDRLRSIRPDAFGVLRRGGSTWPFFLEWERRAVRPVTMAARIAPYLHYYSSRRPTDDHGSLPYLLVVFDEEVAQTHFLRVAREEMDRARVDVPLWVSHRDLLVRVGPLGTAWRNTVGGEPTYAFQPG